MAGKPTNSQWDLCCKNGCITSFNKRKPVGSSQGPDGQFI